MKVSLKWLASYVDITVPVEELARRLTLSTAEVEAIERVGGAWDRVSVGRVIDIVPHPNADRLRLATVDAGHGARTVVCGAPNLAVGQKIAFAEVGANLIDGHTRQQSVLKASKIRGIESQGMVCSERELGLSDEHEGILVLDAEAPVGTPLREYLGDTILDLYSWPHRPDLMSMIGIGREVAALTSGTLREPDQRFSAAGDPIGARLFVAIESPELCARYIGALIEDIHVGPSPDWMQERLQAAGMRPINNVVDITNYVMLEYGQPLHAFDYDRVAGHQIIVRRAQAGERLRTLDDEERILDERMLVIADPTGPVALAGVMGGAATEVTDATTRILLEAASFDGINIRATSTRLRLRSEASARFEKGIAPAVAMVAARRATQLFVELCNGRASDGFADAYPRLQEDPVIVVAPDRIRAVLGVDLPPDRTRDALVRLGFDVQSRPAGAFDVTAPYWRTDVRIPDDVIEEVIRIVGYETIPETTIRGRIPEPSPEPLRDLRTRLQDLLVACGMQEVITYSLVSARLRDVLRGGEAEQMPPLQIAHPASLEHVYLRTNLRASVLEAMTSNMRQRRAETALFETARVYLPRSGDLPDEEEMAVGVLGGRRFDRWGMPGEDIIDFFDVKGIVEAVCSRLRVDATFNAGEDADLLKGRTAQIVGPNGVIGVVGQLDPDLAAAFEIEDDVYLFELRLPVLLDNLDTAGRYHPFSRFPEVKEDIRVTVDEPVTSALVAEIIQRGRYVVDARPFDVYSGPTVPAGRKAVTFAVRYQAPDRTLTEDEISRSRSRIEQQLQRQFGAQIG